MTKNIIRYTANCRAEFAREKYVEIFKKFNVSKTGELLESIAGYNSRKLVQAYRIYTHYLFIFNSSTPGGTAGFYRNKTNKNKTQKKS